MGSGLFLLLQRATHDDKPHGTSSLYAALDLTTGKVIGKLHQRHRAIEFHTFLQPIDREVPAHVDAPLVLDSSCTHKIPKIQRWLAAHPVAHQSVRALNADIRAWIENWNEDPRPYVWTKPPTDPGLDRPILPTNQQNGTLEVCRPGPAS